MDSIHLQHHGVKGMKWGVRKDKRGSGRIATRKRKESPEDKVKKMSDAELRQRLNRIQMERQYKQLTAKETSAGRKFVTSILVTAATAVATSYVQKYMKLGIDSVIGRVGDVKDLADAVISARG